MDALSLLKAVIRELMQQQYNESERSPAESSPSYRNGWNDGMLAALKSARAHLGVAFACHAGCGWNVRARGQAEVDRLMLRYGKCPSCGQPVEMAEVAL